MPEWLYDAPEPRGLIFLIVTVVLGGLAAFVTGRTVAQTWRPFWAIPLYMVLLAAAVRFIHSAVFSGTLLSLKSYLVDLVVLLVIATIGHLHSRRRQMAVQYAWRDSAGTTR